MSAPLALVVLAACNASLDANKDQTDAFVDPDLGTTDLPPGLILETPPLAAFLTPGPQPVSGQARQVSDVTVNGSTAAVSSGRFSTELALPVGLTTLEVAGHDPGGALLEDGWSVLAGRFAEPRGKLSEAVQLRVGAGSFAALGPLLGGLVEPASLAAPLLAANPLLDSQTARVEATDLEFGTASIEIVPASEALELTLTVPDFVLGIDATVYDAGLFGSDLSLSPDIRADEVRIRTSLGLSPDGSGGLDASLGALQVDLVGFDLDTGILELIDWLIIDDNDLAETIEAKIADLGPALEPIIDAQLAGIGAATETELLGTTLSLAPSFDGVTIDPAGMLLELGMILEVSAPEPDVPGHLTFDPPGALTSDDLAVGISDALMNRALFELWAGGALDIELPLDADDAAVLFLFGGSGQGNLSMRSALPPVWLEVDGAARLQMGEIALTVETPGGEYGERVELVMALDAAAAISVTAEAAGVVLSDARVKMRPTGASLGNTALTEDLGGLETAFGLGIGMVNELLSFPLTDLLGADAVLPTLDFVRDPSGLGTVVELSVDDLISVLSGSSGTTGTITTYGGMTVAIPGSATVTDGDDTASADGVVAWICSRDDIVAEGDNGIWYVDDNGEVVIEGTGHLVYVVDGGAVRLESGGNTVYADPGADVEDNDGNNTITVVDPLEFDLSGAPSPGCQ